MFSEIRESASGSDLALGTELHGLVADAVIALVGHGVIALVVKELDRDASGKGLAFGGIGAAVGAEGALADRQVSGFSDNRELDWCHLPLLVPDAFVCLEQGVFDTR